jgi:hypothetical protein
MKTFVAGVALAALVAFPAFAQSYDPDIGTGNIAPPSDDPAYAWGSYQRVEPFARVVPRGHRAGSPHAAYGAATPFGSPSSTPERKNNGGDARTAAVRECSEMSRKYGETTWGSLQMHQFRMCMAQHGQPE